MSGNFSYSIKFQRRKTLAVHVLPDGAVEVRATTKGDDDIDLLWHVTVIAQDAGT